MPSILDPILISLVLLILVQSPSVNGRTLLESGLDCRSISPGDSIFSYGICPKNDGCFIESRIWTHPPICVKTNGSIDIDQLCIFTSTTFNRNQGISVITTPDTARELEKHSAFVESEEEAPIVDVPASFDASPLYVESDPRTGYKYMTASRFVHKHERLLAALPALMLHVSFWTSLSSTDIEEMLHTAISRLPSTTQQWILEWVSDITTKCFLSEAIFSHAGFPMDLDPGGRHFILIPIAPSIDHSCAPNAYHSMNSTTLLTTIHSARTISENEEVSISFYLPEYPEFHLQPFADRQRIIQEQHGFVCGCKRCKLGTKADLALSSLHHYQQLLFEQLQNNLGSPAAALKLLDLYKQQSLEIVLDTAIDFVSWAYSLAGDPQKSNGYHRKATQIRFWNGIKES